jgi:hypothetical protein
MLNDCIAFEGGEIKKDEFNLDKKQDELLEAINLERKLEKTLKDIVVGKNRTAIGAFRDFAVRFGSDGFYKKNFSQAVEQMKSANIDSSLRVKFVLYGQAILARQAIESEIDTYLSGTIKPSGADKLPLVEQALVA